MNAYELPLRVRVEVGRACDDAETACVKRTVGPALYSHLITACCDDIKDECEKRRCAAEAKCIKDAAAKARDDIYSRGGPKRFKFHGPVCTDCEASVSDHMSKCKLGPSSFFDYSATGKVTWYRFGDHVWGKVVCRRTGKTVATIDIWKGEEEYFRPGEDSYGYKSTF